MIHQGCETSGLLAEPFEIPLGFFEQRFKVCHGCMQSCKRQFDWGEICLYALFFDVSVPVPLVKFRLIHASKKL